MGVEMELYGRRKDGSLVPGRDQPRTAPDRPGAAGFGRAPRHHRPQARRGRPARGRGALPDRVRGGAGGHGARQPRRASVKVNRALCAITGYSREQLESTTLASITHPDDVNDDEAEIKRLVAGDASHYRAERRYMHAAGHPVPVDLSVAVIRAGGGDGEPLPRSGRMTSPSASASRDSSSTSPTTTRLTGHVQPQALRAGARARARAGGPLRQRRRGAGDRPRPLQVRQRHARPFGRRRADQPGGEHLPQRACATPT